MPVRPALAAGLLLALSSAAAQAATFTVTNTADSGSGSLRAAILAANAEPGPHTIQFGGGFPNEGVILLASPLPTITADRLTLAGNGREPRIDGAGMHRPIQVAESNVQLLVADLILRNGFAERGGCINVSSVPPGGSLTLRRVTFANCRVQAVDVAFGGAVYWQRTNGLVFIEDSVFEGNEARATGASGRAAGGAVASNSSVSIERTVFLQNRAFNESTTGGGGQGGALYLAAAQFSQSLVEFSQFIGNSTFPSTDFNRGGAIAVTSFIELSVYASWFRGNAAAEGAAIDARRTTVGDTSLQLAVSNTSFANNAGADGGALRLGDLSFFSRANTFFNNSATSGGHVSFASGVDLGEFEANLLAPTQSGAPCSGVPAVRPDAILGANLVVGTGCGFSAPGALPNAPLGTITIDEPPGLIPVVRFSGAAVIDSIAEPSRCISEDARGTPRPQDGNGDGIARCDVGAYEAPGPRIFGNGFES